MFGIFKQQVSQKAYDNKRAERYRELIRREAQIGGQLFGPVPVGGRREFFCLDKYTWVWHEEWQEGGARQVRTTRYEVRPSGVVKIQDGHLYQSLSSQELDHLYQATQLYRERVKNELYQAVA